MRNSPWIQQPRSESAPPVHPVRDPPPISRKEQDEIIERLSRPTESALYRKSLCWKLDSFMDRGYHSWTKLDLFKDWKDCMWTPVGSLKTTYKLRPHRLPGLTSGHGDDSNCGSTLETPRLCNTSERCVHVSWGPNLVAKKCELKHKRCQRGSLRLAANVDTNLNNDCSGLMPRPLPCIH